MTPISSAQTTSSRRVSPAERQYLEQQGRSILLNGGSEEDVVNFARTHVGLSPEQRRNKMVEGISEMGGTPVQDPNFILGLSLKAYQGATFGFGDEFTGTLMGILPGGRTPEEGRLMYRDVLRVGTGSRLLDIAAELAGGVATGSTLARAAGLGAGIGSQAIAGAGGGAASGFGNQTGAITDRAKMALTGGILGGVLGVGFGAATSIAAPILKQPTRALLERFQKLEGLQHRLPGLGTSEDHARRVVLEVLENEMPVSPEEARLGITALDKVRENVLALREQGIAPSIADAGGEGMLALLGETLRHRTPAKQQLAEAIFERQASQGQELSGRLFRTVFRSDKFGLENAYDAIDDISETMRQIAAPMYDEAHRLMVPVSPRVQTLILGNPKLRAAYEEGRRIAESIDITREGQARLQAGTLQVPPLPSGSLLKAAEEELLALNVAPERMREMLSQLPNDFPSELPVRALDYMQQGLQRVKERLLRGGGIDIKEFQGLNGAVEEILEESYAAAPVFQQARQTWAGFSAARDAVELGRGLQRKAPEVISREIAALSKKSPGLTDFYRLGAMQDITEGIGSLKGIRTRDVAGEMFGGDVLPVLTERSMDARRIRALFDSKDAADDFIRRVVAQARVSRTAAAAGSSKPRAGTAFQETEQAAEGTFPFGRSSAILNAWSMARQAAVQGSKRFRSRVADDIAGFFARGLDSPESLDTFIDSLEDFKLRELTAEAFGAKAKLGVSTMLGGGIGNLFAN